MPNHFKIHELMQDHADDLRALEEFARQPARTIDQCQEWLESRGYVVSRGAVANWQREYLQQYRFYASNDLARSMLDLTRNKDAVEVTGAANAVISQIIFESLVKLQNEERVDSGELLEMSMSLKNAVTSKHQIEKLKEDMASKQKKAIDAADAAAKTGASGEAIVQKVREILGVG